MSSKKVTKSKSDSEDDSGKNSNKKEANPKAKQGFSMFNPASWTTLLNQDYNSEDDDEEDEDVSEQDYSDDEDESDEEDEKELTGLEVEELSVTVPASSLTPDAEIALVGELNNELAKETDPEKKQHIKEEIEMIADEKAKEDEVVTATFVSETIDRTTESGEPAPISASETVVTFAKKGEEQQIQIEPLGRLANKIEHTVNFHDPPRKHAKYGFTVYFTKKN